MVRSNGHFTSHKQLILDIRFSTVYSLLSIKKNLWTFVFDYGSRDAIWQLF